MTMSERGREFKPIAGEFGTLDAGELLDDAYVDESKGEREFCC